MNALHDFLICAILSFILIGSFESIISERFKPYVKFISGLFLLIILVEPLLIGVAELSEDIKKIDIGYNDEASVDGYSLYVEAFRDQLCLSVHDYVAENSDLNDDQIIVDVVIDDTDIGKIKVELIKITALANCDPEMIERMVTVFYNAETEVNVSFESN